MAARWRDFLIQTATVVRRAAAARDAYNNPTYDWADDASYPARLTQAEATEVVVGEDRLVSDWKLYLPADADISASDRVRIDGRLFEVVGEPYRPYDAVAPHHTKARLRHVEV